jgi:hypothetical protein
MKKCLLPFLLLMLFAPYSLFSYELGIVTMFRNEANYIKEWIEYHRMLGVDHFLLYNDRSVDHWAEVLDPYINSNLVEVIDWSALPGTSIFPNHQTAAYQDGLRRSKGNTKWLAFIDIDEFILPKKNATILECLNQFFPSASGVYIGWRNFGTNGVYINPGEPILMRLTASSRPLHPINASGKSIVKVDEVVIDQVWSPHQLVLREGAQYYNGSGRPLYFKGVDLQVDPQHTSDYIQINHYAMRDENFYQNVRLPKTKPQPFGEQQLELNVVQEHCQSFNYMQNYQMIWFIKKNYPAMYHAFWHGQ